MGVIKGANNTTVLVDENHKFVRTISGKAVEGIPSRPAKPTAEKPADETTQTEATPVAEPGSVDNPLPDKIVCPTPEKCGVAYHKADSLTGKKCLRRYELYTGMIADDDVQALWGGSDKTLWRVSVVSGLASDEGLDDEQAEEVAERFVWGVARMSADLDVQNGPKPSDPFYMHDMWAMKMMTDEQRRELCIKHLTAIADNDLPYMEVSGRTQEAAAAELERFQNAEGQPVGVEETYLIANLRLRMYQARKQLSWEMRHVAGETGADLSDVWDAYRHYRAEYANLPDPKPEPDATWNKWMNYQYQRGTGIKYPPMDGASAYALWKVSQPGAVPSNPNREYVVFDLETTGFSKHDEHICQVAVAVIDSKGDTLETFTSFVKTRRNEDGTWYVGEETTSDGKPGAAAIHGITSDQLEDAPTMEELAPTLHTVMQDRVLVAHNIKFDHPFLQAQLGNTEAGMLPSLPMYDTLRAEQKKQVMSGQPVKDNKLFQICERSSITVDHTRTHDAGYDVWLTGQVLVNQLNGN